MSHDPIDHDFERGLQNRRRILGDAWVERSLEKSNSFNAEFQNLITRFAWHEIWGRPGLEPKMRRVIVLASTMALARWEEFELHVRAALLEPGDGGLTPDELKEVLMQASIYSGVPAANTGFSLAQHIMAGIGLAGEPAAPGDAVHPGVGREGMTRSAPALHYSVRAPRNGKAPRNTVVLSHALGCDLTMWDQLANELSADCRVICYDHRGHGSSDAPAGPYSMADLADDAARLLRELDSGPVVWVGISMGGMVGQELALRHPSLVAALVIANSTSGYPDEAQAMWRQRIEAVQAGGLEAIADAVMGRYFSEAFRAAHPATVARFRRRLVTTGADGYIACCAAVAAVDTTDRLPRIAAPTLVIAGELDAGTPLPMSETLAQRIPGARLVVLKNASHLSAVEEPEQFAHAVQQFMLGL
ncbi:3-oxoadipate enol-lactonase [Massilia sp. R2A-15]|uniref:bifunctional 4-carboxymuconolactone decarboxylase/3-oxoadipate enol-lactonase PcaCD n=1 Tax=Massilia sp. R2A-15 TaxID=3064278 RepID=UPI002736E0CF|nr:3-oxoadipate enol-lactonase [Massilia sp. R2A-15]WLI90762.1 3-oxoadipate enol-lactonase [Massilia sp. R2A-15]